MKSGPWQGYVGLRTTYYLEADLCVIKADLCVINDAGGLLIIIGAVKC